MKTIYASLPFYDSVNKQDTTRGSSSIPFFCPRSELPSFLINCESDVIATVAVYLVSCAGVETNITSYLPTSPYEITVGTDTYLQYDGGIVLTELPRGSYYVKVDNGRDKYYFSEQLRISDVYPALSASWVVANTDYTTASFNAMAITAVSDGSDLHYIRSTSLAVSKGDVVKLHFFLTLNSGTVPAVSLRSDTGSLIKSNVVNAAAGWNVVTLTATDDDSVVVEFLNDNTAVNFTTSHVFIHLPYSENFVSLAFKNTNDLGDILYSTTFEQKVWLCDKMNTPEHEVIEVGEEKDGQFVAEKIVTKWHYKIVTYISAALYRVLLRLPQNDTIEITDEVGNVFTPSVGNVQILSADWMTFDVVKLTIRFNDGDDTAFSWTYNMDNLI